MLWMHAIALHFAQLLSAELEGKTKLPVDVLELFDAVAEGRRGAAAIVVLGH